MGKVQKIKEQRRLERQQDEVEYNEKKNQFKTIAIIAVVVIAGIIGWQLMKTDQAIAPVDEESTEASENTTVDKIAVLETSMGNIKIKLYGDMPITAGNFEKLILDGIYDGVIFHRVIDGFMIQGGDPTGTGMGDPSIPKIQDEFVAGHSNVRGTISMANAGPNTGSSQFFINLVDNINLDYDKEPLTSKHPVFGEVIEGMEVVESIAKVDKDGRDKPLEDVVIKKAYIEE